MSKKYNLTVTEKELEKLIGLFYKSCNSARLEHEKHKITIHQLETIVLWEYLYEVMHGQQPDDVPPEVQRQVDIYKKGREALDRESEEN